ncbi:sulfotransferase [Ponticaulis sp.]|uniref:sulfotransferase n=1 Tax=Ponticaulis sp. TaxID=2020902 RepID=UPI0025F9118E|nr:sulfotransferase [Ponticaulis sp.]
MATAFINLKNAISQVKNPDVKIFFIGFNKCGTTSFHRLLSKSGIKSAHWRFKKHSLVSDRPNRLLSSEYRYLALEMDCAQTTNDLHEFCKAFTAFSDIFYFSETVQLEKILDFEAMHEAFPKSYFILNDRNEDNWIKSRLNHRGGDLIRRAMAFSRKSEREVVDQWRETRQVHYQNVRSFFAEKKQFLHFDIERDHITKFCKFVSPHFDIDEASWGNENKTRDSK